MMRKKKTRKKTSRKKTYQRASTRATAPTSVTNQSTFEIEKNIEIPAWGDGAPGRPRKYPFDRLEVGDSFFVPYADSHARQVRNRIYSVVSHNRRRLKHGYVTRCEKDGIRVWRNK